MKKKIEIKKIEDKDTQVVINSPEHHIEEIKSEITECFSTPAETICETEIVETKEES